MRDLDPPTNPGFIEPIRVHNPNGISIGWPFFCTDDRRVSLYFTIGRPFPPLKIAPSGGSCVQLLCELLGKYLLVSGLHNAHIVR